MTENNQLDEIFKSLTQQQAEKKLPPVHLWQPERVGSIDIRIDFEGQWWHEGEKFQRQSLVNLFATVLVREGAEHYLVTPAEKLRIEVEDVPFLIVDLQVRGEGTEQELLISSNVGDHVVVGEACPITVRNELPYVTIRNELEARFSRPMYYKLVELGQEQDGQWLVWSQGQAFTLGAI